MSEVEEPILNYWYRALHSPLGIELVCSNVESMRAKLYTARREAKDPDLDVIAVCLSPLDPMKLWMVRKDSINETP